MTARDSGWMTAVEFAATMNISRQAAHKALKAMAAGNPWKGELFAVRNVQGRGGASGKIYEVCLGDPSEADEKALIPFSLNPAPPSVGNQAAEIERRLRLIGTAADYPPRSPERKFALEQASRREGVPIRTLRRYLADAERHGWDMNALGYKRPSNSGEQRVFVSRPFDRAWRGAGQDEASLSEMGEWVTAILAGLWQSPVQRAGWRRVQLEATTALRLECQDRGLMLPREAFYLSKRRVGTLIEHRIVDIRANDRKTYDDWKPRIRRDNSKLAPMDQIVMDVKPIDIVMSRPDGSEVWPKMIAFMDTGTHRIFCRFVMLERGEGVRQEHVIRAFLDMVSDPHWGFPRQLYRDNGVEFFALDRIKECLELVALEGVKTIINARPYSGASKPIESKFAVMDRQVFSQMRGYAGSNRMVKKTQTVGRPPARYPGSFEQFVTEAELRIADFEGMLINSGPFKGTSPAQCFADHVDNGWRPIHVNPLALDAAFCRRDVRTVDRGSISIDGIRYRHPELPHRQQVEIALPYRRDAYPLAKLPDFGWAALDPEILYHPQDIAGAQASGRAQRSADRKTRSLPKLAAPIQLDRYAGSRVADLPTRAAPAPLIDVILSEEAENFAGARIAAAQRPKALTADEERVRRQKAMTRQLEELRRAKR